MVKIDTALGEKAAHSTSISATLSASDWSGVEAPFTQTLSVSGVTAEQNGRIGVAQNANFEQRQAARMAELHTTGQADGTITVVADGEMPDVDIPVEIILID